MPRSTLSVDLPLERLSILNEKGEVDRDLEPKIPDQDLIKLFRTMLLGRELDDRMVRMQRQGRLGTLAPSRGQEAASLGSCYALRPSDWLVPYIREISAQLWRGWSIEQFLLYYAGFEESMAIPEGVNDLPICVPVATQTLHAVGLGWAARLKGEDAVALVFFGDGATSEGDFHEALNFAAVYQAPVIFVCHNNQYAISIPVAHQTRSRTLAQKALAYGMPGVQVDGNDLLAVYVAAREAVERGRAGGGPTLIEAVTYRVSVHTTADDPTRYRSEEEVHRWEQRDPLLRFRSYLEGKGLLDAGRLETLQKEIEEEVRQAVKRFESRKSPDPLEMFSYTFAQLPPELESQQRELREFLEAGSGGKN